MQRVCGNFPSKSYQNLKTYTKISRFKMIPFTSIISSHNIKHFMTRIWE